VIEWLFAMNRRNGWSRVGTASDRSLADIGEQRHEASALHGRAGGSLKRRAASAPLPGEDFILIGAQLLEQTDVLVVDIGRSRATVTGAKPAAILAVATKLLPRHVPDFLVIIRERWDRLQQQVNAMLPAFAFFSTQ